jgi:hypothetical protein
MYVYVFPKTNVMAKTMCNNLIGRVTSINSQKSYSLLSKEVDPIIFQEPRMGF